MADTSWIDRVRAEGRLVAHAHAGIAVVAAAVEAYTSGLRIETARLLETAYGGRPTASHQVGRPVELKLRGTPYQVSTVNTGPGRYRVGVVSGTTEQTVEVEMEWLDDVHRRLVVGGRRYHLVTAIHGPTTLVEVDGVAHRVSRDEGGVLRSPAPALVVATPAPVGTEVEAGAAVVVLESMKMETVVHAPFAARVKELLVITGSQVETGSALVKLEPLGDGDEEAVVATGPDLELPGPDDGADPDVRGARARAALTAVILGYDVPPDDQDAALSRYLSVRDQLRADGQSVVADELTLLSTFADLAELSRNRPVDEERHTELRVHSPREHFHTYLQSLDTERGDLPEQFRERLLRVLRHHGVVDLERTPELEEAVFRIFLAQQRSAPEVALASAVLGCWIDEPSPTGDLAVRARELLERLGRATQLRYPVIGDLARSVRFRWFDQPAVDAERSDVLGGVSDELDALAAEGEVADRAQRIEALAAIPEQIVRFLAERLEHGIPPREPMLEVLARRHYREYDLQGLASLESPESGAGRSWSRATPSTTARPGWSRRSGPWRSCPTPTATSSPRSPLGSPSAATRRPWSTSTCTGPRRRSRPTRPVRPCARCWPRCRWPTTYVGSASPCAPAATARSATTSSGPRARATWSRTTSPAVSTPWSGGA